MFSTDCDMKRLLCSLITAYKECLTYTVYFTQSSVSSPASAQAQRGLLFITLSCFGKQSDNSRAASLQTHSRPARSRSCSYWPGNTDPQTQSATRPEPKQTAESRRGPCGPACPRPPGSWTSAHAWKVFNVLSWLLQFSSPATKL